MEVKDTLILIIGACTLLIAFLTLVLKIVELLIQNKKK